MTTQHAQHTQILSAIDSSHPHLTFPFPFTFGQYGVHRCWVQTGNSSPSISKRTNFKQYFWYCVGELDDNNECRWLTAKYKFAADITLLYVDSYPYSKYLNLPQTLSLNFGNGTAQDIYNFIYPQPSSPLPHRLFNTVQRQLLIKQLILLGEPQSTIDNILWSEPVPGTQQEHDLTQANLQLGNLQISHKLVKQTKKAAANTPEAIAATQQSQFFRLYTKFEFPRETDGAGWPDYQSILAREMQDLSPEGLRHPTTVERHAKWELVFNHWSNLQYLRTAANMSPQETLHIAALIEQVTGRNPLETLNSTTQETSAQETSPQTQQPATQHAE